jgi:hypothetical protein
MMIRGQFRHSLGQIDQGSGDIAEDIFFFFFKSTIYNVGLNCSLQAIMPRSGRRKFFQKKTARSGKVFSK